MLALTVFFQNVEAKCVKGQLMRPRVLNTSAPFTDAGVYVMGLAHNATGPS